MNYLKDEFIGLLDDFSEDEMKSLIAYVKKHKKASFVIRIKPFFKAKREECTIQISAFSTLENLHEAIVGFFLSNVYNHISKFGLKNLAKDLKYLFYIPNDITNLYQDNLYYSTAYYSIDEEHKCYTNKYELLNLGFQTKEPISKRFIYIFNPDGCDITVEEGVFNFRGSALSCPPFCFACIVEDFLKIETPEPVLLINKNTFE